MHCLLEARVFLCWFCLHKSMIPHAARQEPRIVLSVFAAHRKEQVDMADQTPANDDEILYEHEWVAELHKLRAKAGDNDIYAEYLFPAGYLLATGFQLQVNERMIEIPLQRQSPSGLASAVLRLSLPAEATAH